MLEIEIVESNIIDGGIEVFARAWRDGVQIGFGSDGTIDIERFQVINPPILVADPNGDVLFEEWDEKTESMFSETFREDPEEAILQSLEQTISVIEKFGDSKIISGKRGNTTTTVYSNAGGDGDVRYTIDDSGGWDTAHDATSGTSTTDTGTRCVVGAYYNSTIPRFLIYRGFFPFDTSSITTGDTITSATLSLYPTDVWNTDNDGNDYLAIVQSSQASNTALVSGDYDTCGDAVNNPTLGSATFDMTGMATGAYVDFALNATGLGWISDTGYTKLGMRSGHDIVDSQVGGNGDTAIRAYTADDGGAGTTRDPKLVVEHSGSGGTTRNAIFAFGGM